MSQLAIELKAQQEIESLRQQLAESEAERMEQARLLGMSGEREAGLLAEIERLKGECLSFAIEATPGIQLAAAQAREQRLRYALDHYQHGGSNYAKIATEALAAPTDTTALQSMIAKAGEVMRERCVDLIGTYGKTRYLSSYEEGCDDTKADIDTEIRALPGVTLDDIK